MCNICLAHHPTTCPHNGCEEANRVSRQFYFLTLFEMEQTLGYLSHGKFQYCNICFRQDSACKFSTGVALFADAKKTFHLEMWECCCQSACGWYRFVNDSLMQSIHHAPWGAILVLKVELSKLILVSPSP